MAGDKCGKCGEAAVEVDDEEGHVVCTACGYLQDDGRSSYEMDKTLEGYGQACHADSAYSSTFASGNYRLMDTSTPREVALKMWTKYIYKVCGSMKIGSREMQKEAVNIFTRAFALPRFKKLHSEEKKALCGACVYVTCRCHDWPILITDLLGVMDVTDSLLKRLNLDLIRALEIEIKSTSVEDYVPTCLAGYGVTDEALIQKTVSIVNLATDVWLQIGRHRGGLIVAACCIAWQAATPEDRKKSNNAFRRDFLKIPITKRQLEKRYTELAKVLQILVAKVPWVSAAVSAKKKSWLFYLDDILEFKRSLIRSVESPVGDDEDSGESIVVTPLDHPAFKRLRERDDGDENHNERESKIPKSGHLTSESMDCPELSEKDIPDSDLGLYIRTPEEINSVLELQPIIDV